ncbi:hypothetical protein [Lichenibacterium dinghuense]|uniref:hypothetical protein n=1 Tax=Lichenibacterium dinghuense TaxID=2895977 RepID=UPI001F1AAB2B|nr:hypothetical protein [Lichenibacterium sp. 6Y81]
MDERATEDPHELDEADDGEAETAPPPMGEDEWRSLISGGQWRDIDPSILFSGLMDHAESMASEAYEMVEERLFEIVEQRTRKKAGKALYSECGSVMTSNVETALKMALVGKRGALARILRQRFNYKLKWLIIDEVGSALNRQDKATIAGSGVTKWATSPGGSEDELRRRKAFDILHAVGRLGTPTEKVVVEGIFARETITSLAKSLNVTKKTVRNTFYRFVAKYKSL